MDAIASHIWQSTLFALAAGLLTQMLRKNSASVRYWIWFAAAIKFLIPLAALAAVANRLPLPQWPQSAGDVLQMASVVFRSSSLPVMAETTSAFFLGVWLSGVLAFLTRTLWQWRRLAADARRSLPIVEGVVYHTLRRIERDQGISRPMTIVGSSQSVEPGVVGIRKPVLMWPQHLTARLGDGHIETVLAHEVCHVVRRDNLLASVQMFVAAVFWFHPIVWWIGARLVDERERACDERVLALGGRPAIYAESILKTCQLCLASPLVSIPGVTGGDLKRRIVRIMKNEPAHPLGARRTGALLMAALVLFILPTAAGVSACKNDQGAMKTPVVPIQAPSEDPGRTVNRPGRNVTTPRLVRESKPQYTQRAMQEKVQGEVLMECVVKADGTVGDKKIVKSLHPDLDQAALDAAAHWLFEPGTRNGKPANVLVTIAMSFTLK